MKLEEAYKLLGLTSEDDSQSAKKKFRSLIRKYHPDATGSKSGEDTVIAQKLNLAYRFVIPKLREEERKRRRENDRMIRLQNPLAFANRNIYQSYHMDLTELSVNEQRLAGRMYQHRTTGKYYWNPEEEEFSLFLKSIHHTVQELMKKIEECQGVNEEKLPDEVRFSFQVRLFEMIGMQFVRPVECLRTLADPERIDEEGRETYRFRAFIVSRDTEERFRYIISLHRGDFLYPDALRNNRLLVSDGERQPLGPLSFEEDELNFCLIPLLKYRKGRIKMIVESVEQRRNPVRAIAELYFWFRMDDLENSYEIPNESERIRRILEQYEEALRVKA